MPSVAKYRCLFPAFTALTILLVAGSAHAERPITTYRVLEGLETWEPTVGEPPTIFLNRCKEGCEMNGNGQDSRTNSTYLVRGNVTIQPWNKGDEQWDQLVQCVQAMYDPFHIIVTDKDPGNTMDHFEAIVAGVGAEIGLDARIGGIAPFSPRCDVIKNAISFSFANSSFYANGIDSICETVAQETAHAFGLEHAYDCSDPMTYLSPCGPKWFRDIDSSCGELEEAPCDCRASQNSHQILEQQFGKGDNPGPKLSFARPIANTNVTPGFPIEINTSDYYYGLSSVEVIVDGVAQPASALPPYIFSAPQDVTGLTKIEVRGTDVRGFVGSVTIEVNVGAACTPGSCGDGRVCYKDYCIAGAQDEGGFSSGCTTNEECGSGLCVVGEEGGSCSERCDLSEGECPANFGCLAIDDSNNVCWAGVDESDDGGCGCNSSPTGTGYAGLFLLGMLMFFRRKRAQH